jgi:site-specific recombinase XerD
LRMIEKQKINAGGIFDSYIGDFARREKHKTALTYHRLLSQFEQWLAEQSLGDFDEQHVIKFLEGQQWSNATRNTFLAAIRGWSKNAKSRIPSGTTLEEIQRGRDAEKRLERIEGIRDYKVERKEKAALSLEQISGLFDAMDPDTFSVFWILLWFGFRVGELKMIKGIDWEAGRLEVETEKVGGTRTLFFDGYTARILKHASDKGLLDMPDLAIWKRLRKYSGFCRPVKFTLKRMLGHHYTSATDVYVHRFDEQIREVMVERHYLKALEVGADGT